MKTKNNRITFEIDNKLKQKFQIMLLRKEENMSRVLHKFVERYTKGEKEK